jgi:hypothetical protein
MFVFENVDNFYRVRSIVLRHSPAARARIDSAFRRRDKSPKLALASRRIAARTFDFFSPFSFFCYIESHQNAISFQIIRTHLVKYVKILVQNDRACAGGRKRKGRASLPFCHANRFLTSRWIQVSY